MSFFKKQQKVLAAKTPYNELKAAYELSEAKLKTIAKTGNARDLARAMDEHRTYEYAMLYRQTPEFNKRGKTK